VVRVRAAFGIQRIAASVSETEPIWLLAEEIAARRSLSTSRYVTRVRCRRTSRMARSQAAARSERRALVLFSMSLPSIMAR
jgi:hypothetical protein